jgi:heme A synthase
MPRRRQGGERTFETVRERYQEWSQNRPPEPKADWTPSGLEPGSPMPRIVFTAIGVGTCAVLLVLAAISFWRAYWWADAGREAATIGYVVIGAFLLVAGIGGMAAVLSFIARDAVELSGFAAIVLAATLVPSGGSAAAAVVEHLLHVFYDTAAVGVSERAT